MDEKESLAPGLLVASPHLSDPNFHRSVVLLFHHSPQGALGLVVNRPTQRKVGELLKEANLHCSRPAFEDMPILLGGPVAPAMGWVVYESDTTHAHAFDVGQGIKVSGSLEVLELLLSERGGGNVMLLLGYAGWAPGQLESELRVGAWLPAPVQYEAIFGWAYEDRWRKVLLSMGIDPMMWSAEPGEA